MLFGSINSAIEGEGINNDILFILKIGLYISIYIYWVKEIARVK